ncbi:MAG: IscS subfamily cysteine desulfurase [Myxococcales bacterium]|nr:IscS subfamily cysteine desulfurase [Myxococcales bacterium]
MVQTPIYFDNHATTPLDPRVLEAMMPYLTNTFGNSASRNHSFGWAAEDAVEKAREEVASLLGAHPKEIIWTSGATESDNLAIKGIAHFYQERGKHIITSKIEHKAVIDACRALEVDGFEVTYLTPGRDGLISVDQVEAAMRDDTILVSLMHVNNELGVINPIKEIGALTRERKVFFHCDAVQSIGRLPFDVNELNVDLVAISGHKLYGPKGVGALYVRRKPRVRLAPIIHGGGHERGFRSGTLNVPGIVGFGKACALAEAEMHEEDKRVAALRDRLHKKITDALPEVYLNGSQEHRVSGNLNISFAYVEGESLLMAINKDVAVSSGSACTSASLEPSYVLRALGVGDELAHSSIRFGLGRFSTEEEVDYVANLVIDAVTRLRDMSPLWKLVQEGVDLNTVQWTGH